MPEKTHDPRLFLAHHRHGLIRAGQSLVVGLVLASLGLAISRTVQLTGTACSPELTKALTCVIWVAPKTPKVVVCFFYGTQSCPPCTGLREACQNTVNRNFARELAVGTVLLREVNIDAPENRLIQPHLHGAMVTIALVDYRTGKPRDWRLLTDQVWRLRSDETAFSAMLRDEIRKMLK